jgi:hypothetical protein
MALRSETMWKVGWGLCGFPSLIVGPKRAAYFASTQIRDECAEMFEPPWPAFYVSLRDCPWSTQVGRERARYTGMSVFSGKAQPNDLVVLEGDVAPGSRVWTWVAHTEVNHVTVFRAMYSYNWDSKKVNPWTWSVSESSLPPDEEDVRMSQVLCQLVAGIALEFQSTEGAREAAQKRAHGKGQRDRTRQFSTRLPRGSVYVLGDDVVVDARPAVADYIAGNSSSPSVRSFVRPHPRMQAHGPGWSQRRLIRIEGYWKGPADAPVVIRTHRFGADDA